MMSENKKQHYVPQFYLRNFSRDQKQVWVYHLASESAFLSPISNTCQGKFFYGSVSDLDKILQNFESAQAPIIKDIIENQTLIKLTSDDWINIQTFILVQSARTKDAKIIADNFVDFFVKHYIKPMMKARAEFKKYSPESIDSLKITVPNMYKFFIGTALSSIAGISDLTPILLINKTQLNFISSDAPVVKNNSYKITNNDLMGIQSPGLQIFCPLNENLILLLLHKEAYEIIGEHNSVIELNDVNDIASLNLLQILNSQDIVLFSDQNDLNDIQRLHQMSIPLKDNKEFSEKKIIKTKNKDGGHSELVNIRMEGVSYRRHFSFIRKNHQYSRWFRLACKENSKYFPILVPYRNKKLVEMMNEHFELFMGPSQK